jgi:hypothetical protein
VTDVRSEIIRRCASVGVAVAIDRVVCRVDGDERSYSANVVVELCRDMDSVTLRAATNQYLDALDAYDTDRFSSDDAIRRNSAGRVADALARLRRSFDAGEAGDPSPETPLNNHMDNHARNEYRSG